MSATWSDLLAGALGTADGGPGASVDRLTVRPGEVLARVRDARGRVHDVSLIRTVLPDTAWERACAALASQPVFRARISAGELPAATARVFEVLGLDLVPRGWSDLVATCSCDRWEGRCAHLSATAAALGEEADRDPFALARWSGRERRALVDRVAALSAPGAGPPAGREEAFPAKTGPEANDGEWVRENVQVGTAVSAAAFWSAPAPPSPPCFPETAGARVRAAAPGAVTDGLPVFSRVSDAFEETE
ncbi:hypothetical protein KIK06_06330 [Nocardiopsis sp. EMB25]|uniref:SWIM zinc finger family protein n=1 Tax=Nocardiopsis sp. EMB25 TaxID=2835867 RepID=UPI002283ADF4|nr:hypothetical protein [Nocardiopsis sp. EMB25]MCY9783510.1 hypothetical protein [Nocardiopsis sp. EMB25]